MGLFIAVLILSILGMLVIVVAISAIVKMLDELEDN